MPIYDAEDFETGAWKDGFNFGCYRSCDTEHHVAFLHAISTRILKHPTARNYPDLMTLGYYCRRAETKRCLQSVSDLDRRFGWGTALHIAPSNIPVNFAFSFVMGFLSGNSNIIRLPTRIFEQMEIFVEIFDVVCAEPNFKHFAKQTAFVKTKHDSDALRSLVAQVHALIVWGGDETVRTFRAYEKTPRCVEVYFPNRISSTLLSAKACLEASEMELKNLANAFFNDSYLVDQNACSSPSLVFWLGSAKDCQAARDVFWQAIEMRIAFDYKLDPIARIDRSIDIIRLVDQCGQALHLNQRDKNIWLLNEQDLRDTPLRFGTFWEIDCPSLDSVVANLRQDEQTLTVFGVSTRSVFDILKNHNSIVDRIVPVGQALNIGVHWDGREMLTNLSRKVEV